VVPLKNTKFAVHWAPAVKVWTPGWMVAVAAGAHVGAAEASGSEGMAFGQVDAHGSSPR
jgi:hypothetical protein